MAEIIEIPVTNRPNTSGYSLEEVGGTIGGLLGGLILEYNSAAIDTSILKEFSLFFNGI